MKVLKEQKGLTIVELMVAISILSIVSIPISNTLVGAYKNIRDTGRESQFLFQSQRELEMKFTETEALGTKTVPIQFYGGSFVEVRGDVVNSNGLSAYVISEVKIEDPTAPGDGNNGGENGGGGEAPPPVIEGDVCHENSTFRGGSNNIGVIRRSATGSARLYRGLKTEDFKFYFELSNGVRREIPIISITQRGNSNNYQYILDYSSYRGFGNVSLIAVIRGVEINDRRQITL